MTDATLVRQTLEGSLEAFDQLMVRYQRLVYRVVVNYSKDREHALDITQNTFLKAYEKLPSLGNPERFKAWLLRIAFNECSNWWRRLREYEPLDGELAVAEEGPEHLLTVRERRERVCALLDKLNPKYRQAVVLKYYQGCSIREIAGVLQCREDVVKNMLYRGMRKLASFSGEHLQAHP